MKKIGFKKNNQGMTLIELLVAIAIFASAIVPLLFAFVYSTGYNYRSQSTMQSTGIAQAIIEKCKGSNVDSRAVSSMLNNGAGGSIFSNTQFEFSSANVPGTISDNPCGVYEYFGVHSVNYSAEDVAVDNGLDDRRRYDVKITVSPSADNMTDFSSIQAVSTQTAVFGIADANMLKSEDFLAESKLFEIVAANIASSTLRVNGTPEPSVDASSYYSLSDVTAVKEQFTIDRYITIEFADTGVTVSVKYYIEDGSVALPTKNGVVNGTNSSLSCTASYSGYSKADNNPFYTVDMDPYGHSGGVIYSGAASALYFYYFPNYNLGGAYAGKVDYTDHFDITNNMGSSATYFDAEGNTVDLDRLDVFLYKQYDSALAGTPSYPYNNAASDYKPTVSLNSAGNFYTYLYHNFYYDINDSGKVTLDTLAPSVISVTCDESNFCFDCSDSDTDYDSANFATTFRDADPTSATYGKAPILSDFGSLPNLHDPSNSGTMFPARYHITVEVRLANHSETIETMEGDFLSW